MHASETLPRIKPGIRIHRFIARIISNVGETELEFVGFRFSRQRNPVGSLDPLPRSLS